jgi:predicted ABC-type exoprotein transport system permease subunit
MPIGKQFCLSPSPPATESNKQKGNKTMKNFKKYAEAIVNTAFEFAITALIVALAIFLSGRGDIVNKTAQAVLWYFIIGVALFIAYSRVRTLINQK